MKAGGVYSLKLERLTAERQQSIIRLLLAITSSLILIKYYFDMAAARSELKAVGPDTADRMIPEIARWTLDLRSVVTLIALLMIYSVGMWALVRWKPERLDATMAGSSILEIVLITYLIRSTAGSDIPFYLWYVFYVVRVATRYGWLHSILALSASIVSFTLVICTAPLTMAANVPVVLGFTGFLLVLAFMFGQISEKQLSYQASLSVVNEFRGELSGLATSSEIINHLLVRTRELLHVEDALFLPAKRGADASESPGLRSAGDCLDRSRIPVLLSTFREDGGGWNVEEVLREQKPLLTNKPARDPSLPEGLASKLGLRHLAAAPMMVRSVPVGVVYAANRKDRRLAMPDVQLLELVATQAVPAVENALLWERLREAAASEERLRIARDLHDNFLQTLAAIKLHLERCKILVPKDTERALEGIDRIHQISTRGLAEVRSYLSELRLMGPEPSRFREAVSRCSEDAATRGGFHAELDMRGPEEPMAPNVALAAFQILRELLNNAVEHAQAKNVRVSVAAEDGKLTLEVEDDGVGFDVARVRAEKASQGHLGLVGVEERARQSDGTFSLISEPGKGTKATAVLSL